MSNALIFIITEKEVATNIKRPVEWCWGYKAAEIRCTELDKESEEYTHSFTQAPNFVDAR